MLDEDRDEQVDRFVCDEDDIDAATDEAVVTLAPPFATMTEAADVAAVVVDTLI